MIVIKYGGSLMDDKSAEKKIIKNIKQFAKKNPVVVVHGGGKEITNALKKSKIETKFVHGLRYTDVKSIKIVEKVLENIQDKLVKKLKNAVAIKKVVIGKRVKELGYVGKFTSAKLLEIEKVLKKNKIAVISPVGKNKAGQILNFNADEVAGGIAAQVKAKKLIFFTDVPGVLDVQKKTISVIKIGNIKKLIDRKIITGGMLPKITGCVQAVKKGVGEVDIWDINLKGTKIL
ncbi:MAG: acetylglutamate kinase [Elusimicrobia bacterium]|nr:acetylglutamate kinase [Elusimicrobiota bacterium]